MKFLFTIGLFFLGAACFAQKDTSAVLNALLKMEKALVEKSKEQLEPLLHKDVAFGHSTGWVQTKKDVLKDMESGFLVYTKIDNKEIRINASEKRAVIQEKIAVKGSRDGKDFDLNLHVMHVWIQTKEGWKLYARQSTKL